MSMKQAERDGLEDGWLGWKKEKKRCIFFDVLKIIIIFVD